MNRFLETPELKDIVCDELRSDKESLLALALSSQELFFDPAMDKLWERIDSFDPLLSCISEDVWREEEQNTMLFGSKRLLVLPNDERAITPMDLARFRDVYAERIKCFSMQQKRFMRMLSLEFLESLKATTAGQFGALAPRLQSFTWIAGEPMSRGERPLLIPGAVSSHALSLCWGKRQVSKPSQRRGRWHANVAFARSFLTSASWPQLRSLKLRKISDDTIPHLAALPRLSSLTFEFVKEIVGQHARTVSRSSTSFQRLEELSFPCDRLTTAAKFLEHLPQLTGLRVLRISAEAGAPPLVSQYIINLVRDRVNSTTLQTLELRDNEIPDIGVEPMDAEPLREHDHAVIDMRPLFVFPNLTKLVLTFEGRVQVTPGEVPMITSSWSDLEHLDLCGTYPITRLPSIDYTHLFQIAEGCPRLHTLGLPFDATAVTGAERSPAGPFTRLKNLHVAGSLVEYPACVAAFFLRANFPNVRPILGYNSFSEPTEPHWRRWVEVARALSLHDPMW